MIFWNSDLWFFILWNWTRDSFLSYWPGHFQLLATLYIYVMGEKLMSRTLILFTKFACQTLQRHCNDRFDFKEGCRVWIIHSTSSCEWQKSSLTLHQIRKLHFLILIKNTSENEKHKCMSQELALVTVYVLLCQYVQKQMVRIGCLHDMLSKTQAYLTKPAAREESSPSVHQNQDWNNPWSPVPLIRSTGGYGWSNSVPF